MGRTASEQHANMTRSQPTLQGVPEQRGIARPSGNPAQSLPGGGAAPEVHGLDRKWRWTLKVLHGGWRLLPPTAEWRVLCKAATPAV